MSFFSNFFKPKQASLTGYEQEFNASLTRTQKWKLNPPPFTPLQARLLTDDVMAKIQQCWASELSGCRYGDFSQKCFQVTSILHEPLQEVLGVPLIYTLGYVQEEGKGPIFHTELAQLKKLTRNKGPLLHIDLHAWLTLPTYEILDFTLLTTLGTLLDMPDLKGRAVAGHPEDFPGQPSYHPQLIGDEFLLKSGLSHPVIFFTERPPTMSNFLSSIHDRTRLRPRVEAESAGPRRDGRRPE